MADYKIVNGPFGQFIRRAADAAFIPIDEANVDYREFLAWQEDGNTPDPADPPSSPIVEIPSLDFLNRFADGEKAAIYGARHSVWQVDDFITQLVASPFITLDDGSANPDPRVKAGVDFLVAAGLLSADRAAAVLAP